MRQAPKGGAERSFVQFVLEPLYKIYSTIVGRCLLCVCAPVFGVHDALSRGCLSQQMTVAGPGHA